MDFFGRLDSMLRADPELAAYIAELRDIGRTAEQAFVNAPIGMALGRLDGRFFRVNQSLCDLLGYDQARLSRLSRDEVTHPEDRTEGTPQERAAASGIEQRFLTADGVPLWVAVVVSTVRDDEGNPSHLVTQVQDVSERRRVEADLRHAADHDPLTGLLNRRRFERDLAHQIELCRRYGQSAAVVLLDLDHLKHVNDSRGHQAGDALLVGVSRVLAERLRASDVLARLGGDEFAVLLALVGRDEALAVASELVDAVGGLDPFGCTASAGVAVIAADSPAVGEVIDAADRAMYAAKHGGRNRAVLAQA